MPSLVSSIDGVVVGVIAALIAEALGATVTDNVGVGVVAALPQRSGKG